MHDMDEQKIKMLKMKRKNANSNFNKNYIESLDQEDKENKVNNRNDLKSLNLFSKEKNMKIINKDDKVNQEYDDNDDDEGYYFDKNGIIKYKKGSMNDPWLESVKDYNFINNNNNNNQDMEKNEDIEEEDNDEKYYGEEALEFNFNDNITEEEMKKDKQEIQNIKEEIILYLNKNEDVSQAILRLKEYCDNRKINESKMKNSDKGNDGVKFITIEINGKKIRKNVDQNSGMNNKNFKMHDLNNKYNTKKKDDDILETLHNNDENLIKYKRILELVCKATNLGFNDIYSFSKTSK